MPSIKYTYGVEFDPNASLAISISNAIYDDDGAKYKFRGQINNDPYGNVIAQLYNGINNLSEDYILEQYKVSFNINFSDTTGNVTLNGHDFDDIIQGGVGDDILRGGAGDDTIRGMGGADTFWGGDGDDRLVVREAGASVHGDAGMDKLFLQGGDSFVFTDDTLQNVEIIHLGAGSELDLSAVTAGVTIIQTSKIGTPGTIVGTQDADTIIAGGGYVSIRGGDGDDVLKGTTGLPSFAGEGGNDVITLGMRGGHATGGEGDDVLVGSSVAPSALHGDSGNDRIKAGAGGATIGGGADADKLFANSGEDLFVFTAGFGRDNLYGLDVENDRIAVAMAGVESGDLMFRSMNGGQDTLVTFRGVESSNKIILHDVHLADLKMAQDDLFLFGA
ncbi:calcium-binding protein [Methylobacterium sp. CM6241]